MGRTHPDGYGTAMISLEQMKAKHGPKMHPEFSRRFFAYMDHKGFGVGGGWRAVQPVKPGFAPPGKSFHESQTFASGIVGYCAIDLVVAVPGQKHRSPTWAECEDAPQWGLHTFVNNEPWHVQPIEIRGFDSWVNAGRPDPKFFTLPGVIPPTPPATTDEVDMIAIDYTSPTGQWTAMTYTGTHLAHVVNSHADSIIRAANVQRVAVNDAQLDGLIESAATTTDPPPEFSPARKAAWTAQRG